MSEGAERHWGFYAHHRAPCLRLSGRHRLRLMLEAYEGFVQGIPATYEILYCTLKKRSE